MSSRAFRYLGQLLKIRDCPGDSGTVGAYVISTLTLKCNRILCAYKQDEHTDYAGRGETFSVGNYPNAAIILSHIELVAIE